MIDMTTEQEIFEKLWKSIGFKMATKEQVEHMQVNMKSAIHEAYEANLSLVESLTKERDFLMGKKGTGSALVAYIRRMHKAEADIQNIEAQTAHAIFAELDIHRMTRTVLTGEVRDNGLRMKVKDYNDLKAKYLKATP